MPEAVAEALHLSGGTDDLDGVVQPRGYRMLARVPRLPDELLYRLVDQFQTLDKLSGRRSTTSPTSTAWVSSGRTSIKDALAHIAESSILDRYT